MKAYLVRSTGDIEPFGEHPRECLIANRPLAWHQEQALREASLELVEAPEGGIRDPDEHVIFEDRLFFTPELIREFVIRSRTLNRPTFCALKRGVTTHTTIVATQGVPIHPDRVDYDLCYVPAGQSGAEPQELIVDPDQVVRSVPMPQPSARAETYDISITDTALVRIDHWTSITSANFAYLVALVARRLRQRRSGQRIKLLPLALKALSARSRNRWKILSKLNRVGRDCDIHPTAYVEASILGNNVTIGAGAVIRASMIGDGARIANNTTVEFSVIGEKCRIWNGGIVNVSVLYPGVQTATRLSSSLCGRNVFMAGHTAISDFRFDGGTITVLKDGAPIDTGYPVLGSCFGHGSALGSGAVVAPGRAVPNGWKIAIEDERMIRAFPADREILGYQVLKDA